MRNGTLVKIGGRAQTSLEFFDIIQVRAINMGVGVFFGANRACAPYTMEWVEVDHGARLDPTMCVVLDLFSEPTMCVFCTS